MTWNPYFLMKWGTGDSLKEKRFSMYQGGRHLGTIEYTSVRRAITGDAVIVRPTKRPRFIEGVIPFYEPISGDYGTLAELTAALHDADLQVKGYDDAAYWNAVAIFNNEFVPEHYDPHGNVTYVQIRVEER